MRRSAATALGFVAVCSACRIADHEFVDDDQAIDAGVDAMSDPAMLTITQEPFSFGDVSIGSSSATLEVLVRNEGGEPTSAIGLSLTGDAADFEIVAATTDDCEGAVLGAGDSCHAVVRFAPETAGSRAATLMIEATSGGSVSVDLSGNGLTAGALAITAGAVLDFAVVEIASSSAIETVTVHNTGGSPTASLTVEVSDPDNYTVVIDECGGGALAADATCDIQLRFDPAVVGSLPTQLSIRESPTEGVAASASGTGSARLQLDKTGVGTVTSSPGGTFCGDGCATATQSFTETPVVLTATPDDVDHVFDSWSGACAGTLAAECTVPLTAPLTTVGVTFRTLDCTPDTIVCDDTAGHYVDCSSDGAVEFEMDCPLGCATTSEQCIDVDPSNGVADQLDMAPTGPDVAFSGNSTINTSTGVVFNGGASMTVPSEVVGNMRVFMFNTMSIAGTLRATGSRTLVIVVDGDVTITGTLDASSDGVDDPSGVAGPGVMTAAGVIAAGSPSQGAGGGGHSDPGGDGGAAGNGTAGGAGAAQSNNGLLVPLIPGATAQGVNEGASFCFSAGGLGGGAVQIVSRTRISLSSSGKIDASGGGGSSRQQGSCASVGGGGGGSGGSVLLEAPQIVLDGAGVVVATRGGGGAAAGAGCGTCRGGDGGTGVQAAAGGSNGTLAAGGAGGTESVDPGNGGAGAPTSGDGGGGGGSVGVARFNTEAGTINPQNGATVRSSSSSGAIGTRLVP